MKLIIKEVFDPSSKEIVFHNVFCAFRGKFFVISISIVLILSLSIESTKIFSFHLTPHTYTKQKSFRKKRKKHFQYLFIEKNAKITIFKCIPIIFILLILVQYSHTSKPYVCITTIFTMLYCGWGCVAY